jgi:hypothetical protein
MIPDHPEAEKRPDPDDLTRLVHHLSPTERSEHDRLQWQFRACVAFWILALGFAAVAICWGVRQLL